jgi:hypothetical protein
MECIRCSETVFSLLYACNDALLYPALVIRIIYRIMLFIIIFVYLSMLLQRFYSLILPNPGVQIAYNKYMSIYSSLPFKITLYAVCIGYTKSVASISNHVRMGSVTCSVLAAPTRKSGSSEPYTRKTHKLLQVCNKSDHINKVVISC